MIWYKFENITCNIKLCSCITDRSAEVWKCLGEEGLEWLTELFNVIFRTAKMPEEWRSSKIIHLYKNKGDV